jgi:predicted ATPase
VTAELPSGTVTFVFSDIEGSTRRWQDDPEAMPGLLAEHDAIWQEAIAKHGGVVFKHTGDGVAAVFVSPGDAVDAAMAAQEQLGDVLPVRVGVHTGGAQQRDGDYFGTTLNRCARLMGVAHGGQVLCSAATAELVRDRDDLADLGEHRLRDLDRAERIWQIGSGEFPALASLSTAQTNLPVQPTSFVGRGQLLADVVEAMSRSRLVTLIGVGGVGKTRLALQAAAEVAPVYRGGVWLVELASVRDPDRVADTVAAVFGVSARAGLSLQESLVAFLRDEELLLVVDNTEHLLRPVAELVAAIEAGCAGVHVLVTTREGLGIAGEQLLVVPPLSIPSADNDPAAVEQAGAVQLFVDRARAQRLDFTIDDTNRADVVAVCRRLDGVPLAIELAAARISMMNPAEIAERLDRRFRLLAGGDRVGIERHQTLRAAVDWSYELLSDAEQQMLNRLSVFAGGCTLAAAEAVCVGDPIDADDVLELLSNLVARSLVVAEPGPRTRYRLLETIRQYAEEHLALAGETDRWRTRHLQHYTRFLAELRPRLHGPEQVVIGAQITSEHDNLIAAMSHALDTQDLDQAMALLSNHSGWEVPGEILYFDAAPVLDLPGAREHPSAPSALARVGMLAHARGDRSHAIEMLEQAKALQRSLPEGDLWNWLHIMYLHVNLSFESGEFEATVRYLDETADQIRASDLPDSMEAWALATKAQMIRGGDPAAAISPATDALDIARRSGMPTVVSFALCALAGALAPSEPERAAELLHEAEPLGMNDATGASGIAFVAARLDQWPLALRAGGTSLQLCRRATVMAPFILIGVLSIIARALAPYDPRGAVVILGAARPLATDGMTWTRATDAPGADGPNEYASIVASARRQASDIAVAALGEDLVRELRREGEAMDRDKAITYALTRIDQLPATATLGGS